MSAIRSTASLTDAPEAGWRTHLIAVLKRTVAEILGDRIPSVAAGITFFILLAMFPAIASIVSLYGMFADRSSIAHILDAVGPFVPGGAVTVLSTELHRLVAQKPAKLNLAFVIGFLIATWSASGGITALVEGLNVAYETKERRGFVRLTLTALFFTVAGFVVGTAALTLAVVAPAAIGRLSFLHEFRTAFVFLRLPLVFLACAAGIETIYYLGPDRRGEKWRGLSWGALAGAALWMAASALFAEYVEHFGSYDRVYGSLGAAVGFLTWIWILLVILLAGAELNCELDRSSKTHKRLRQT